MDVKQNRKVIAKPEVKRTHYRSWKSGKRWLYAAGLFTVLTEGATVAPVFLNTQVVAQTQSDDGETADKASTDGASDTPVSGGGGAPELV
jgi:hypothetical protein